MIISLLLLLYVGSLGWARFGWLISVSCGVVWARWDLSWEGWGSSLHGVSHPLVNCSKLVHTVAEGFPATRENKPHYASTFPVTACVIFPSVPLATASYEAKPELLLAGPS